MFKETPMEFADRLELEGSMLNSKEQRDYRLMLAAFVRKSAWRMR